MGQEGTVRAGDFIFLCGTGSENINWKQDFLHHRIVSAG